MNKKGDDAAQDFSSIIITYQVIRHMAETSKGTGDGRVIEDASYVVLPEERRGLRLVGINVLDKVIYADAIDNAFDAIKKDVMEIYGDCMKNGKLTHGTG